MRTVLRGFPQAPIAPLRASGYAHETASGTRVAASVKPIAPGVHHGQRPAPRTRFQSRASLRPHGVGAGAGAATSDGGARACPPAPADKRGSTALRGRSRAPKRRGRVARLRRTMFGICGHSMGSVRQLAHVRACPGPSGAFMTLGMRFRTSAQFDASKAAMRWCRVRGGAVTLRPQFRWLRAEACVRHADDSASEARWLGHLHTQRVSNVVASRVDNERSR